MDRNELRRLIRGPIATVPTAFDKDFEVDLGRMAELTRWWVANGLVKGRTAIKVAAAMGEGPQLRDTEWPALLRTVVQASDGKAAVVAGLHYKDTKRCIEDAKRAQDLGAIGLQISPPVFNAPTDADNLRHFEALSNAIDIGILIYCRAGMPGGDIMPEIFKKMYDFEKVIGIKWGPPAGVPYEAIYELAGHFNIIDNRRQPVLNHKLGGCGFVQNSTDVHPEHSFKVWDLLEAKRYDEAQAEYNAVEKPLWDFYTRIRQTNGGQGRLKKAMMALLGRPMGVSRPPSLPLSPEETADLRKLLISFGWPVVA
ncbi:MAG: dihydrodipicolinate synthase family protein [SAR202 cluster bacterium]|nr:dihydrodipicolinate synthase family protein [SAR202 cluster bacterium]